MRLLGRYYAPGFHSFFGAAPGASGMQNGLGGVADIRGRRWRIYKEIYHQPQWSYFVPVAATYATWCSERVGRVGGVNWWGQWQGKLREQSQRWRLDADRAGWWWWGEIQRSRGEWGALGSARYRWRYLALHISRFHTDSYATRIYEHETDLPGTVSIRPLYGSGWRGYAQVSYRWQGWNLGGRYRLQWDWHIRRYGGVQIDWTRGDIDKL